MADEVRLWRYARHGARIPEWRSPRGYEGDDGVPYVARPAADDEAREERLRVAEQQADALVKDRGEMLARAEKAEAQRDAYISGREMQRDRAEKAERERDTYRDTAHAMMGAVFGEEPPWTDEKIDRMEASTVGAEAALADAVKAERQRIAKHLRDIGLAGPAKDVERCPSCYDLGVVGAGDEPCTAVACDAHAAKMREDAARRAKA